MSELATVNPLIIPADYREAIEREVTSWPGVTYRFGRASKHLCCEFSFNNATRKTYIPASPSDAFRGAKKHIIDVRRALTEMGAVRTEQEKAAPREREPYRPAPKAVPKRIVRTEPAARPMPDPLSPLATLQRSLTNSALLKWSETNVNIDRLDEAARILIDGWHPEIIVRAAQFINDAKEQDT